MAERWTIKYPALLGLVLLGVYALAGLLLDWDSAADLRKTLLPYLTHVFVYLVGLGVGFTRLTHPRGEIGLLNLVGQWVASGVKALVNRS